MDTASLIAIGAIVVSAIAVAVFIWCVFRSSRPRAGENFPDIYSDTRHRTPPSPGQQLSAAYGGKDAGDIDDRYGGPRPHRPSIHNIDGQTAHTGLPHLGRGLYGPVNMDGSLRPSLGRPVPPSRPAPVVATRRDESGGFDPVLGVAAYQHVTSGGGHHGHRSGHTCYGRDNDRSDDRSDDRGGGGDDRGGDCDNG